MTAVVASGSDTVSAATSLSVAASMSATVEALVAWAVFSGDEGGDSDFAAERDGSAVGWSGVTSAGQVGPGGSTIRWDFAWVLDPLAAPAGSPTDPVDVTFAVAGAGGSIAAGWVTVTGLGGSSSLSAVGGDVSTGVPGASFGLAVDAAVSVDPADLAGLAAGSGVFLLRDVGGSVSASTLAVAVAAYTLDPGGDSDVAWSGTGSGSYGAMFGTGGTPVVAPTRFVGQIGKRGA